MPEDARRRALGLAIACVALGLLWRGVRFALAFPIWQDEAYLNISIWRGDYGSLSSGALEYLQVAPLLFLWAQRTAMDFFGGGEYAIRVVPLLAGAAALLLFARLAWVRLGGRPAVFAIALFAGSYVLVRHTTEAKQYATDLLAALALLTLGLSWVQQPECRRRAAAAVLLTAVVVWASFPLVFVAGGVGLVLLGAAVSQRSGRALLNTVLFGVVSGASFLTFYFTFAVGLSRRAAGTWLEAYWDEGFPPTHSAAALGWWLLEVHTGKMMAYPLGGGSFASSGTLLLCVIGAVALWTRGGAADASERLSRPQLLMLLAPIVPALLAALLHKYPYGGSARVCIYLAPSICLLAGAGAARALALVPRAGLRERATAVCLALLMLLPVGGAGVDIAQPYKLPEYAAARDAMRTIAGELPPGAVVAIVNTRHDRPRADGTRPPDGPEFPPTLRYYLELFTPVRPHWCGEAPPPRATGYLLTFHGSDQHGDWGPQRARVEEVAARIGRRVAAVREYSLSGRGDIRVGVYECGLSQPETQPVDSEP